MEERSKWIDCAKFLAIAAVLVDHSRFILYENQMIQIASFYSVSLFIIIAGMMSFRSISRHRRGWLETFVGSSKRIVLAYALATFIYQICGTGGFDFAIFLQKLLLFNTTGPFYYVLVYIQLMLISKAMYVTVNAAPKRWAPLWYTGLAALLLLFVTWTTNRSYMLDSFGGSGKLFGGTYLLLFYFGMLLEKSGVFNRSSLKKSAATTGVCLALLALWLWFESGDLLASEWRLPFDDGINPPGLALSVLAMIMLFLSWGGFSLLERVGPLRWIPDCLAWLGRRTLYIYLYHRLFLDLVLKKYVYFENIWLMIGVFIPTMVFGPILIETAVKGIKRLAAALSERAASRGRAKVH